MNHPNQEEWVSYLDDEISSEAKKRLSEHLTACPQCAAEIAGWERSIRKIQRLPFPKTEKALPTRRGAWTWAMPALKWGIAAAFVLAVGFAFGRLNMPDTAAIEDRVPKRVREQLNGELQGDVLAAANPKNREVKSLFQKQLRLEFDAALAQRMDAAMRADGILFRQLTKAVQQGREEDRQYLVSLVQQIQQQQN